MNIRKRTNVEKVAFATRILREVYCDERKKRLSEKERILKADRCTCGHTRGKHLPIHSVNYTEGACTRCDCKYFLMS